MESERWADLPELGAVELPQLATPELLPCLLAVSEALPAEHVVSVASWCTCMVLFWAGNLPASPAMSTCFSMLSSFLRRCATPWQC